jgi:hypothetical protein
MAGLTWRDTEAFGPDGLFIATIFNYRPLDVREDLYSIRYHNYSYSTAGPYISLEAAKAAVEKTYVAAQKTKWQKFWELVRA